MHRFVPASPEVFVLFAVLSYVSFFLAWHRLFLFTFLVPTICLLIMATFLLLGCFIEDERPLCLRKTAVTILVYAPIYILGIWF